MITRQRPSWLFITAVLLALLFTGLGLLLALGRLPGRSSPAAGPPRATVTAVEPGASLIGQEEVAARAGVPVLWPRYLPPGAGAVSVHTQAVTRAVPAAPVTRVPAGVTPVSSVEAIKPVPTPAPGEIVPSSPPGPPTTFKPADMIELTWAGAPHQALEPFLWIGQTTLPPVTSGRATTIVRGRTAQVSTSPVAYRDATGVERQGDEVGLWWREGDWTVVLRSRTLPLDEVLRVAESLTPVEPPPGVAFRRTTTQGREGPLLVAGRVGDFASPSVTHLADARVYLLRAGDSFVAYVDEDAHLGHPTGWDAVNRTFHSPAHGEQYDWQGRCIGGPCPRGLDRYPVQVRDGRVLIDPRTPLPGPESPSGDAGPPPPAKPWP